MNITIVQAFRDALDLPGAERAAFLDTQGLDAKARAEVDALLLATEQSLNALPEVPLPADISLPNHAIDRRHQLVGTFRLLSPLGSGGMGAVWLAERVGEFAQKVAIKWLHAGLSESARQRFSRERETLAKLEHPGIARIVDGGRDGEADWFAMEYVDGSTLDRWSAAPSKSLQQRVDLIVQVCEAVQFAHQNLVVHRDLKPSNIMITHDGHPKLLDFGVAKLLLDEHQTESSAPLTFAYAAPEQIKGEAITTATDVYALGVILFELLTGERPHKVKLNQVGDGSLSLLQAITDTDATAPSSIISLRTTTQFAIKASQLKGDLDTIVLKALSRDPQRRYASAQALAEDLKRYRSGFPISARRDSLGYRIQKWLRRKPALAAVSISSLLMLMGMAAYSWQQSQYALAQARIADAARARSVQAQAQIQRELEVQSALRDHFVGVIIRATAAGTAISPDELLRISSDTRLGSTSHSGRPMSSAAERALRLSLATMALLRQDDAQLREMLATLSPLMDGASSAEKSQFAMFQGIAQSYADTQSTRARSSAELNAQIKAINTPTMLVLQATLALKGKQFLMAQAAMDKALKLSESVYANDPMMQAAVHANAVQILFESGEFSKVQGHIDAALQRFATANIQGHPVPMLRALPANIAVVSGRMHAALAIFSAQDGKRASNAERAVQDTSIAIATFWSGRESVAQKSALNASEAVCVALNKTAAACTQARLVSLEISLASLARADAERTLSALRADGVDPKKYKRFQILLELPQANAADELDQVLLSLVNTPIQGRERWTELRFALSLRIFLQRSGYPAQARQAQLAAIALARGLDIPADSAFAQAIKQTL